MFKPIKVLIVDNNRVVRKMISEYLETVIGIEVLSTANNGISGIEKWHRYNPELILTDLDMPGKNGYEMSTEILKDNKPVAILVVSALNNEYAERVVEMVSKGVVSDYIVKPSDIASGNSKEDFWRALSEQVLTHGQIIQHKRGIASDSPPVSHISSTVSRPSTITPSSSKPDTSSKITPISSKPDTVSKVTPSSVKPVTPTKITNTTSKPTPKKVPGSTLIKEKPIVFVGAEGRDFQLVKPQAVLPPKLLAIGSSTGGPAALTIFLKELKRAGLRTDVPVFITQHMPPIFTARLAEQLTMNTGFQVIEAQENMIVENGKIYLAPGDYHMHLGTSADGQDNVIRLKHTPKVNFCRPAVDEMLDSLLTKYKASQMLTVILTGMGSDGKNSCIKLRKGGGTIFAQNEETSAVWGMPGAVATANICSAVSPLNELARKTVKYMKEARL